MDALRQKRMEPVSYDQALLCAKEIKAHKYLECSARTNEGVREVFEHATRAALLSRKSTKRDKKCLIL